MRSSVRRFIAVAVAIAGVAALAGFAWTSTPTSGAKAAKVNLTYFTFSAAPDHLKDLQNIINGFERAHPNINIKVQTASYGDYFTKLQTQIASGQAPDSFELNYENFVTYAAAGKLLNLSKIAKGDRSFRASIYYPRAYKVFQLRGRQYGLPETFSVVLLFYNKDLFRQAGVPLPKKTWKWKDELAAAKRLGIWQFAGLKDAPFDWDVTVEPGNVRKAHHFFANAVVASAKTKHKREVWTWLRYFSSSSNAVKTRVKSSWELPAVRNTSLFKPYLAERPPQNRAAVFQALSNIVTPPVIKQEQQLQDIVGKWLDKAVAGQVSAAEALHSAAAEVNNLLKNE